MRTAARRLLAAITISLLLAIAGAAGAQGPYGEPHGERPALRIGLSGVVARSDAETLDRFLRYLEERVGHGLQPVLTRGYRQMDEMIAGGAVDIAYVCGSSYVLLRQQGIDLQLLAAPLTEGRPEYYSLVLVRADTPYQSLDDLRDKPYAFADPESNSGTLVPTYELHQRDERPQAFFRPLIHVHNHAETVHALRVGLVDGVSIGSHTFSHMATAIPGLADELRVAEQFGPYPSTPLVAQTGVNPEVVAALRAALLEMTDHEEGRKILRRLGIDGYGSIHDAAYEPVRRVVQTTLGRSRAH